MHGHDCMQGRMNEEDRLNKLKRTTERNKYISEKQGHPMVIMWECEYHRLRNTTPELKASSILPPHAKKHPNSVTAKHILHSVRKEELFGVVEVDIKVCISQSNVFISM